MNHDLLHLVTIAIGAERYKLDRAPTSVEEAVERILKGEATYCDGRTQCISGKTRSIIDTVRTVLGDFPKMSVLEVFQFLAQGLLDKKYQSSHCPDIKKLTIYMATKAYVNNYSTGGFFGVIDYGKKSEWYSQDTNNVYNFIRELQEDSRQGRVRVEPIR